MIKPIAAIVLSALFSTVSGLATAQDLASFHAGMGGCTACHGTNAVTAADVPDDEIDLNNKCMVCHGDYKKLADKTKHLIRMQVT